MSKKFRVAVIVGSLRKGSYSGLVAKTLIGMVPSFDFEIVEIGTLPLFNQDLEETPPTPWVEFRDRVRSADALLFITPEYNRSIPAALKNAIDVGSRPYGKSVWDGKPGAVVSVSPGAYGGFGANHHLRQTLMYLNVATLQQPEVYLAGVSKLFDDKGNLVAESAKEFLQKFMTAFTAWVEKISPVNLS